MSGAALRNVEQYLDALREALRGADPALVQDALYDAEEHLRAELAQAPSGDSESDVLARIVTSYGAPEEVADAYRANEVKVRAAHAAAHAARDGAWPVLRRLPRSARISVVAVSHP